MGADVGQHNPIEVRIRRHGARRTGRFQLPPADGDAPVV